MQDKVDSYRKMIREENKTKACARMLNILEHIEHLADISRCRDDSLLKADLEMFSADEKDLFSHIGEKQYKDIFDIV